jgi:hypothetical protein
VKSPPPALILPWNRTTNRTIVSEILTLKAFPPHLIKAVSLPEINSDLPHLQRLNLHSLISKAMLLLHPIVKNAFTVQSALITQTVKVAWIAKLA